MQSICSFCWAVNDDVLPVPSDCPRTGTGYILFLVGSWHGLNLAHVNWRGSIFLETITRPRPHGRSIARSRPRFPVKVEANTTGLTGCWGKAVRDEVSLVRNEANEDLAWRRHLVRTPDRVVTFRTPFACRNVIKRVFYPVQNARMRRRRYTRILAYIYIRICTYIVGYTYNALREADEWMLWIKVSRLTRTRSSVPKNAISPSRFFLRVPSALFFESLP